MRITSVEKQKHNQNRYNVYIDGAYSFSAFYDDLAKFCIKEGVTLTEHDLQKLIYNCQYKKALEISYRYLSVRQRSSDEIKNKLAEKKIDNSIIEKVIEKLTVYGYLNDEEFTKAWIQNRISVKPSSKKMITYELKHKGINKDIIDNVMDNCCLNELDSAITLVKKKLCTITKNELQPCSKEYQKIYRYLLGKGFDYETAAKAIKSQLTMPADENDM